jgi:uncharacterized membrane protein
MSQSIQRGVTRQPGLARRGESAVNVGTNERVLSGLAGAALAAAGLKRGGLGGIVTAAIGAGFLYRGTSGHCQLYSSLGINTSGNAATPADYRRRGIHVTESTMIEKPASELYAFWRDFTNLPKFMKHVNRVDTSGSTRSTWAVDGPFGELKWDAEILHDVPNELIAWKSVKNADVDNSGSVRFIPQSDGSTKVQIVLDYIPPGGTLGKWVSAAFGKKPESLIREDVRRFKQLMEAGEVPTTEGQPQGA